MTECADEQLTYLTTPCMTCSERLPKDECPKALRGCGHHCNCSWETDECCWCGTKMGDKDRCFGCGDTNCGGQCAA